MVLVVERGRQSRLALTPSTARPAPADETHDQADRAVRHGGAAGERPGGDAPGHRQARVEAVERRHLVEGDLEDDEQDEDGDRGRRLEPGEAGRQVKTPALARQHAHDEQRHGGPHAGGDRQAAHAADCPDPARHDGSLTPWLYPPAFYVSARPRRASTARVETTWRWSRSSSGLSPRARPTSCERWRIGRRGSGSPRRRAATAW